MRYLHVGLGILTAATGMAHASLQSTRAQPTTCITSHFSATGSQYWKSIVLKLTNNCSQAVDFQNTTISFQTTEALNTSFWGDFSPLSYPDNVLNITSQQQPGNQFLATLNLHFPSFSGANSLLPIGSSISIKYGATTDSHIEGTTNVYLSTVVETGSIQITNSSAKPTNVSQNYAMVHLTMNGQSVGDIQLPWQSSKTLSGLAAGNYTISADTVTDSAGNNYVGQANPSSVNLVANETVSSIISYAQRQQLGKLRINLQNVPNEIAGYSENPSVLITQANSGNSQTQSLSWGSVTTVSQLAEGSTYQFSTSTINYNGYNCLPTFTPASLAANATNVPVTNLTYQCIQVAQDSVRLEVNGAPPSLSALKITLTPNNGSQSVEQTIDLTNGSGSASVSLTDGVIYTVSTNAVSGYTVRFSPQPLTATPDAVEIISLTQEVASGGRIIGYIPGWKTPPTAQALANAGYTHVMIAFGVFSTSTPGVITPAFDTVTKDYIQSLHAAGIKVLLSLGGALTSLPNTSVDFHQVLTAAASAEDFKQTFINSLNGLITQYHFDGFDIDIEHGINGGGTFSQPQGDIAVLASIINTMHNQNPSLLITLTPQVANIAATRGFDQTWGNYASLVMQTHTSLAWVGIQLYNTGCAFGIDLVCYGPIPTNTPDFSVAMATDLLANWPASVNGQTTGFQPYISHLQPSQVVIGYPSANANGQSDGSPITPTATIKRAIQCLKTAVAGNTSCGSYIPPQAYGNIGGVFNWEVTYDQSNSFKFATELKNCVINGICN
ncbi:chitinase [Legionella donaldsonii]|uniref:chitinase n=1 Tax=Legionella donaldsonii TaxID=45060 RepID=A0A378J4F2_9GAMM|nr:glycosyl hydrolase family 18 protein [Legionella donaldsonii]STX41841.1 chitinase [Legionella donaldsonii]